MKSIFICLSLVVIFVIPAFAVFPDSPHVKVSGKATVSVEPDSMKWSISIKSVEPDLTRTASMQDLRVSEILSTLKELGINEKNTHSSRISLEENWINHGKNAKQQGYIASTTISFDSEDLHLYRTLWLALTKTDYIRINSVILDVTNRTQYQVKARKQAVRAAKQKAAKLLAELDCQIGHPLSVKEVTSSSSFENRASNRYLFEGSDTGSNTDSGIGQGLIKITASVDVAFEIVCP